MLTSIVILTIVFICLELTYSLPAACSFPDPAVGIITTVYILQYMLNLLSICLQGFTNDKYEGKWFEIGKVNIFISFICISKYFEYPPTQNFYIV